MMLIKHMILSMSINVYQCLSMSFNDLKYDFAPNLEPFCTRKQCFCTKKNDFAPKESSNSHQNSKNQLEDIPDTLLIFSIGENYSNRKVFMTFIRSNQNHQIIHRNITMKSTSI